MGDWRSEVRFGCFGKQLGVLMLNCLSSGRLKVLSALAYLLRARSFPPSFMSSSKILKSILNNLEQDRY
jgi:hypothetical protein